MPNYLPHFACTSKPSHFLFSLHNGSQLAGGMIMSMSQVASAMSKLFFALC